MYPDKITRNSKGIGYCAKANLPKEGPDRGALYFQLVTLGGKFHDLVFRQQTFETIETKGKL